jgi:hypothetical protein
MISAYSFQMCFCNFVYIMGLNNHLLKIQLFQSNQAA